MNLKICLRKWLGSPECHGLDPCHGPRHPVSSPWYQGIPPLSDNPTPPPIFGGGGGSPAPAPADLGWAMNCTLTL